MHVDIINRVVKSYGDAERMKKMREERGEQPVLLGVDRNTLMLCNAIYLFMCLLLHSIMRKKKVC